MAHLSSSFDMVNNLPVDYALMLKSLSNIASSLAGLNSLHLDNNVKALVFSAHSVLGKCAHTINHLSPILRLPRELLTLIFSAAQDGVEPHEELQLPITLSHVCAVWRDVVIMTPLLWTRLSIYAPWKLDLVRLWLSRSGSCPIDLQILAISHLWPRTAARFTSHDYRHFPSTDRTHALWDVLVYHLPRCRNIKVEANDVFYPIVRIFRDELHNLSVSLPLLEDLSLQGHRELTSDVGTAQEILPLGVPALRHLKIGIPLLLPEKGFDNLISLHIQVSFLTLREFQRLLSSCNLLTHLATYDDFSDYYHRSDSSASTSSTSLLSLPSLKTLQTYNTVLTDILLTISAPSLAHLVIALVTASDIDDYRQGSLMNGQTRFPSLTSLTLVFDEESWHNDNPIQTASTCFPGITHLGLIGSCALYARRALEVPAPASTTSHHSPPWPKLCTLAIRASDWQAETHCGGELKSLLASRSQAGLGIDHVFVDQKNRLVEVESIEQHVDIVERDIWTQLRQDMLFYPSFFNL